MKVELISETADYKFQHKINEFISRQDISVIDIKYSTTCVKQEQMSGNTIEHIDTIMHNALIMYEEQTEMDSKIESYSKDSHSEDSTLLTDDDLLLMLKQSSITLGYAVIVRPEKVTWYDYNYHVVAEYNKEQIVARLYHLADEQNYVIVSIRRHIRPLINDLIQSYVISNR